MCEPDSSLMPRPWVAYLQLGQLWAGLLLHVVPSIGNTSLVGSRREEKGQKVRWITNVSHSHVFIPYSLPCATLQCLHSILHAIPAAPEEWMGVNRARLTSFPISPGTPGEHSC